MDLSENIKNEVEPVSKSQLKILSEVTHRSFYISVHPIKSFEYKGIIHCECNRKKLPTRRIRRSQYEKPTKRKSAEDVVIDLNMVKRY